MCEFPREKNIAMLCNTNLWAGSMKGVFGGKRAKILKMVVYASETFSQRDLSQNVSRKPEENFKIHSTSTGILLSIQNEKISKKDIVLCTQKYTPTKFCKSTLVFHNFVIFFYFFQPAVFGWVTLISISKYLFQSWNSGSLVVLSFLSSYLFSYGTINTTLDMARTCTGKCTIKYDKLESIWKVFSCRGLSINQRRFTQ